MLYISCRYQNFVPATKYCETSDIILGACLINILLLAFLVHMFCLAKQKFTISNPDSAFFHWRLQRPKVTLNPPRLICIYVFCQLLFIQCCSLFSPLFDRLFIPLCCRPVTTGLVCSYNYAHDSGYSSDYVADYDFHYYCVLPTLMITLRLSPPLIAYQCSIVSVACVFRKTHRTVCFVACLRDLPFISRFTFSDPCCRRSRVSLVVFSNFSTFRACFVCRFKSV